jgi:hypothetical protein
VIVTAAVGQSHVDRILDSATILAKSGLSVLVLDFTGVIPDTPGGLEETLNDPLVDITDHIVALNSPRLCYAGLGDYSKVDRTNLVTNLSSHLVALDFDFVVIACDGTMLDDLALVCDIILTRTSISLSSANKPVVVLAGGKEEPVVGSWVTVEVEEINSFSLLKLMGKIIAARPNLSVTGQGP